MQAPGPDSRPKIGCSSLKSQVYCVLDLGYFKAKHLFFNFKLEEMEEDTHLVLEHHFAGRHFEHANAEGKQTRPKLDSPVAWQHINYYGRYEFGKHPAATYLEEIVEQWVRIRFESELMPTA
jgi:hypothetical protein